MSRRGVTHIRRLSKWHVATTLLVGAITVVDGAGLADSPADRFPSLREQPLRQYCAYRRMHARSEHFNQEGWLEAWTEMDERGFRYNIVSETGSDTIRSKVLKAVLKRE